MTALDKQLAALREALPRVGFKEDRYGHFQKEDVRKILAGGLSVAVQVRVKIQKTSARLESKSFAMGSEWVRVDGAFLRDVVVTHYGSSMSVVIGRYSFKSS